MPIPTGQSDEFNTGFASGLGMTVQTLATRQREAGAAFDLPTMRDSPFASVRQRLGKAQSEWCRGYVAGIERGFDLIADLWQQATPMAVGSVTSADADNEGRRP